MPISIKNSETELIARKLADLTGETLTEAIRLAVLEKYERLRQARHRHSLGDDLNEIAMRCARRPIISDLSADEILGYDESGVPARCVGPPPQFSPCFRTSLSGICIDGATAATTPVLTSTWFLQRAAVETVLFGDSGKAGIRPRSTLETVRRKHSPNGPENLCCSKGRISVQPMSPPQR